MLNSLVSSLFLNSAFVIYAYLYLLLFIANSYPFLFFFENDLSHDRLKR